MLEVDMPTVDSVQATPRTQGRRRVLFVAVPDADPFDLIGPLTVLHEANYILAESGRGDLLYTIEFVSSVPGTVFESGGFRIEVDESCHDVQGEVDTVVFQAIDLAADCLRDEQFIAWVRDFAPRCRRMVTACIGSFILAEAGLLDGKRAATHWALGREFRRRFPRVCLDTDPIYVKDGKFYTSAGLTSILDLMVALVEEDFGAELALRVAQGLVMFLRRPATQSQFSTHLAGLDTDDERIRTVVSHITNNPGRRPHRRSTGQAGGHECPQLRTGVRARDRSHAWQVRGAFAARDRPAAPGAIDHVGRPDRPGVRVRYTRWDAARVRPKPRRDPAGVPEALRMTGGCARAFCPDAWSS